MQAWWRNINKTSMGIPAARKKAVFNALIIMAKAESIRTFTHLMESFKASTDYQGNPKLQDYLTQHWWSCTPQWAACYRQAFHGGIDTNNHGEALNKVLKYQFLNKRQDSKRLESLLRYLYFVFANTNDTQRQAERGPQVNHSKIRQVGMT